MRKLFTTVLSTAALLLIAACSQRTGDGCCGGHTERSGASRSDTPAATGATQGQPTRSAEVAYTCPMHPEVIRSSPGKCPTCGMDLVRKN